MEWSRQRWFWTMALIFGGQVAAIFALHTREPLRVKVTASSLRRPLPLGTNSVPQMENELSDPLIFAGAHPEGFSGSAWLGRPVRRVEFSNNIAPAKFLAFQRPTSNFSGASENLGSKAPLPFLGLPVPQTAARESALLVEGDLADRALRSQPKLQKQYGADVLGPTIVQAAAQADGFLFSARIVGSSGSRAADLAALQIANSLRFAPAPPNQRSEPLEWGNLVFQWATATPPSTNAAANTK